MTAFVMFDEPATELAWTTPDFTLDAPTVLDRLLGAGISETRARWWLDSGGVLVDQVRITDPAHPAARPSRVVLSPPEKEGG